MNIADRPQEGKQPPLESNPQSQIQVAKSTEEEAYPQELSYPNKGTFISRTYYVTTYARIETYGRHLMSFLMDNL